MSGNEMVGETLEISPVEQWVDLTVLSRIVKEHFTEKVTKGKKNLCFISVIFHYEIIRQFKMYRYNNEELQSCSVMTTQPGTDEEHLFNKIGVANKFFYFDLSADQYNENCDCLSAFGDLRKSFHINPILCENTIFLMYNHITNLDEDFEEIYKDNLQRLKDVCTKGNDVEEGAVTVPHGTIKLMYGNFLRAMQNVDSNLQYVSSK